jgi:hypothetical protein
LIKHNLVHRAWRPLVELTRIRHLRFREKLLACDAPAAAGSVVTAGV